MTPLIYKKKNTHTQNHKCTNIYAYVYKIKIQNVPKTPAHSESGEERQMKLHKSLSLCCTMKRSQQTISQPWDV